MRKSTAALPQAKGVDVMTTVDPDDIRRAQRLAQMMNERLRSMTPQERDRIMQVHLAQARGPVGNALALRWLTNALIRARTGRHTMNPSFDANPDGRMI